jgi:hypothetical protein
LEKPCTSGRFSAQFERPRRWAWAPAAGDEVQSRRDQHP